MDGTVNEASLEEGRPVRCGTPDGDGVVLTGAARNSCLVSTDTVLSSVWFLCIVVWVAAALEAVAVLDGATPAGLLLVDLGTAVDFITALVAAGGDFLAAVLAGADATLGLPTAALTGLDSDFVTALVALAAVLGFAGMAFTS